MNLPSTLGNTASPHGHLYHKHHSSILSPTIKSNNKSLFDPSLLQHGSPNPWVEPLKVCQSSIRLMLMRQLTWRSALEHDQFSDLKIKCKSKESSVHKVVVCTQSSVLLDAVTRVSNHRTLTSFLGCTLHHFQLRRGALRLGVQR